MVPGGHVSVLLVVSIGFWQWGLREGQNMAHLGHFNCQPGQKFLVQTSLNVVLKIEVRAMRLNSTSADLIRKCGVFKDPSCQDIFYDNKGDSFVLKISWDS